jgi:hypothetical protein
MNFDQAQKLFKADEIATLAKSTDGLRFLKLRSVSRREYLETLLGIGKRSGKPTPVKQLFRTAYDAQISLSVIDKLIRTVYEEERKKRKDKEDELVSELYQLQVFNWGGLHQNSLEKTIVDNYVKKIRAFDVLCRKIDNELHNSLRGYVLCSWYNHWTSIVIEDVFRDHSVVLPALGQVKKIDFFIHDTPFDLKVTYLPEGFIVTQRQASGLRPELTLLKQMARRKKIHFDPSLPNNQLLEDLWMKVRDHPSSEASTLIDELAAFRLDVLSVNQQDPAALLKWLYENQGVRRFDASNRLFLVLVDRSNFFESWKLKRARPLLVKQIASYLDGVGISPEPSVI